MWSFEAGELNRYIREENQFYGDMVFLNGIPDTYANLHIMVKKIIFKFENINTIAQDARRLPMATTILSPGKICTQNRWRYRSPSKAIGPLDSAEI